MIAEKSR